MTFILSNQNVFEYLAELGLSTSTQQSETKVERKYAKNFNLLVSLADGRKLLVKQEPQGLDGKTAKEFVREWRIQEFIQSFPEIARMSRWVSEALHFDAEKSIIIFNYLNNYRDLMDFYMKEDVFPLEIPTAIGTILANIHSSTFENREYQEFFSVDNSIDNIDNSVDNSIDVDNGTIDGQKSLDIAQRMVSPIGRIGPEIFGLVPADGLKFFALYQRYDSLGKAIAQLGEDFQPCCLTHNDLKLNNILLSNDWQQAAKNVNIIRLIDWERCCWGDPAFDLGALIGSYLLMWLGSLVTSRTMNIDESLRMATTPLERLQPSIAAIATAYLENFPEILVSRPDFFQKVVQFVGLNLITAIQSTLQYQKSFGNTGICMLQVAKSLLCRPEAAMTTIFGVEASEFLKNQLVVGQ